MRIASFKKIFLLKIIIFQLFTIVLTFTSTSTKTAPRFNNQNNLIDYYKYSQILAKDKSNKQHQQYHSKSIEKFRIALLSSLSQEEAFEEQPTVNNQSETNTNSNLISSKSIPEQKFIFLSICTLLSIGTIVTLQCLEYLQFTILPYGWFELWRDYTWPIALGIFYTTNGRNHFLNGKEYMSIVPPKGTWGFWNIPTPGAKVLELSYEAYLCYLVGIIEIIAGSLLTLSGIGYILGDFDIDLIQIHVQIPAAILGILTILITPSNIYMFTHNKGITMQDSSTYSYSNLSHALRAIMQMILISFFWLLTFPDFFIVDYSESLFDVWLL